MTTLALCLAAAGTPALSQEATEVIPEEPKETLMDAITGGTIKANIRARAEILEEDGLDTAQAYTLRTRLGYLTQEYHGVQFYLEFENVVSADDSLYNDGPGNSDAGAGKAVIPDPEVTEVNQAWMSYAYENSIAKGGRQTINLDDQRFIGSVEFRQDNRTYDAVRGISDFGVEGLEATAGYIFQVNQIFGEEGDYTDTNALFLNGSYAIGNIGTVTGFGYFLDFDTSPANSSNTVGVRFTGDRALGEDSGLSLVYAGSVAYQQDAGNNPVDYAAPYYAIDLGLKTAAHGTLGAGYEVLGSDDGNFGFRTPLATAHKFNGFADEFIVTPADGLEDVYLYYGLPFPKQWKTTGKLIYHFFSGNDAIATYGQEFDVVITKKLSDHFTISGQFAYFDGDEPGFADRTMLTLDLVLAF